MPLSLTLRVRLLLDELDPYGLAPGEGDGFPVDGYDPEATSIASLMLSGDALNITHIDDIWQYWFSEPLTDVVGAERIDRLVEELRGLSLQQDEGR